MSYMAPNNGIGSKTVCVSYIGSMNFVYKVFNVKLLSASLKLPLPVSIQLLYSYTVIFYKCLLIVERRAPTYSKALFQVKWISLSGILHWRYGCHGNQI